MMSVDHLTSNSVLINHGVLSYDDYKKFLIGKKEILENELNIGKVGLKEILNDFMTNTETAYASNDGIYCYPIKLYNADKFMDAVEKAEPLIFKRKTLKSIEEELKFLDTEQGKEEYTNGTGRYNGLFIK